ncbi:hypothetical protein BGX38DRAFT_901014 [Terfezia claveryi]|nr:hypothetical protein BGX38DRAFT_901014 [Terfezia claveryi]
MDDALGSDEEVEYIEELQTAQNVFMQSPLSEERIPVELVLVRFVIRNDKLDDRVAGLRKDLGDFKGDVNKSLGELATRMEAGFGRMKTSMEKNYGELKTSMEKNYGELKADIKPLVWQVRILLGRASLVIVFLVKTYLDEHNIFNKKLADAMPQPVSGPAVVAHKIDPKK